MPAKLPGWKRILCSKQQYAMNRGSDASRAATLTPLTKICLVKLAVALIKIV